MMEATRTSVDGDAKGRWQRPFQVPGAGETPLGAIALAQVPSGSRHGGVAVKCSTSGCVGLAATAMLYRMFVE